MMRFRADLLALTSLLIALAPAQAEEPIPSGLGSTTVPIGTASAPEPDVQKEADLLSLSLQASIEMALQNNLDVEIQRFGPLITEQDETISWGAYDPEFFAEFGYARNKDPNSFGLNQVANSVEEVTDGFGGFRGIVPLLGSFYDFRFNGSRRATNSSIESLSPALRSSFSLSLTQPLLQGLWWNEPWTRLKTSQLQYDQSLEEFRFEVMNIVQRVEDAYWDLIAKEEQMNVRKKSLETAEALLEQSKTEYEVGVASKVKVVESEAGVAQREFELIRETNLYRSAQDVLVDQILGTRFTAEAALTVKPSDAPDEYIRYVVNSDEATKLAFDMRPELSIAQDRIDAQELDVKFAKNLRLPQLDIVGTYGNRGLAGSTNKDQNPTFSSGVNQNTDFGDSMDNFLTDDAADQSSIRAVFSIPIPNTSARARVSQSNLILRQLKTRKRRTEQDIILEIRRAIRDIATAQDGIEAARRETASSTEQLRAERVRLEYGESTPFDVLQREEQLVESQSREIGAFQFYRTSITALHRAQGTILRNRNIAIDEVRAVR